MKYDDLKRFSHPRKYYPNNIKFRILSSDAYARYKLNQSIILRQLELHAVHKFSKTAKEILLFKFDSWYDFLCKIEQYYLMNETIEQDYLNNILNGLLEYQKNLLFSTNLDKNYLEKYFKTIKTLNAITIDYIPKALYKKEDFGFLVDFIIRYLKELFYIVFELDIILYKKKLVIFITDFCDDLKKKFNINITMNRFEFYTKLLDNEEVDIVKVSNCVECLKDIINNFQIYKFNIEEKE